MLSSIENEALQGGGVGGGSRAQYLGEMKSSPLAPVPVKHRWIFFMNCRLQTRKPECVWTKKFSTLSSSVVDQIGFNEDPDPVFFISMRNRIRIQGVKPMRIPTDPDPGRKKLTLYMKIYFK
jgi:hypothetical protein